MAWGCFDVRWVLAVEGFDLICFKGCHWIGQRLTSHLFGQWLIKNQNRISIFWGGGAGNLSKDLNVQLFVAGSLEQCCLVSVNMVKRVVINSFLCQIQSQGYS